MMSAVASSRRSTGAVTRSETSHPSSGPRVHDGSPRSAAVRSAAAAVSCQATTRRTSASSTTYATSRVVAMTFIVMTVAPAACRP